MQSGRRELTEWLKGRHCRCGWLTALLALLALCLLQTATEDMTVSDGAATLSTSHSAGEYTGDRGFARVGQTIEFVARYTWNGKHIPGAPCQIVFVFQTEPFTGANWVAGPPEPMREAADRYVYSRSFDKAECVYFEVTASKAGYPTLTTKPKWDVGGGRRWRCRRLHRSVRACDLLSAVEPGGQGKAGAAGRLGL